MTTTMDHAAAFTYTTLGLRPRTANRIDVIGDVIHGIDTGIPVPGATIEWNATYAGRPCVTVFTGRNTYRVFNADGKVEVLTGGAKVALAAVERELAEVAL